jgi:hypothetical protein
MVFKTPNGTFPLKDQLSHFLIMNSIKYKQNPKMELYQTKETMKCKNSQSLIDPLKTKIVYNENMSNERK